MVLVADKTLTALSSGCPTSTIGFERVDVYSIESEAGEWKVEPQGQRPFGLWYTVTLLVLLPSLLFKVNSQSHVITMTDLLTLCVSSRYPQSCLTVLEKT